MALRFTISCEELRRRYEDEGLGVVLLAQHYGCSPTTISQRLRACGITTRQSRFQSVSIPVEALHQLYMVERLPLQEIAQQFGVSVGTVRNHRRRAGMPARERGRK